MDVFQSTSRFLHRSHRLLVHLRRLEGIHIHLQLEPCSLQLLQLVLQHLLPLQRSDGSYTPIHIEQPNHIMSPDAKQLLKS